MTPTSPLRRIVRKTIYTEAGCLEWGGHTYNGYGRIGVGSRSDGSNRNAVAVHRVAYEILVGPVPADLDLDHLCRNRACWRPDHLEPVTRKENVQRGLLGGRTHCKHGHPLDAAYVRADGGRDCRTCRRERRARWKARQSGAERLPGIPHEDDPWADVTVAQPGATAGAA